jgi:hypothetical protein
MGRYRLDANLDQGGRHQRRREGETVTEAALETGRPVAVEGRLEVRIGDEARLCAPAPAPSRTPLCGDGLSVPAINPEEFSRDPDELTLVEGRFLADIDDGEVVSLATGWGTRVSTFRFRGTVTRRGWLIPYDDVDESSWAGSASLPGPAPPEDPAFLLIVSPEGRLPLVEAVYPAEDATVLLDGASADVAALRATVAQAPRPETYEVIVRYSDRRAILIRASD